jgi:basic amino acid/polyamine antiporter, APA family
MNDKQGKETSVFVRKSTGLVREASFADAAIFTATFSAPVGTTIAFGLFWALGAFPGTNILLAIILSALIDVPILIMMGYMASAMPRTGGDYVWVSRILSPALGMVSSFAAVFSALIGAAYWARIWGPMGVGPTLVILGNVVDKPSLVSLGNWAAGTGGTFLLGMFMVILLVVTLISGTKRMFKIQNTFFAIAMIGTVLAMLVFVFGKQANFIVNFNAFAQQYTNVSDSYNEIITLAKTAGYDPALKSTLGATLPSVVCIFTFMMWNFWSVYLSGEMKSAGNRKRQLGIMFTALLWDVGFIALGAVLIFNVLGKDFFTAINFLSTTAAGQYPLPVNPYFTLFAGVIIKNPLLNILIALSFLFWNLPAMIGNTFMPVRSLFAWSFDRVLPKKLSDVNERTHTPVPAILVVGLLVTAIFIWSTLSTSFFTLLAMGVLCGVIEITLVSIAAIRMPYSQKDLYETSPAKGNFLGIPVLVITGVLSLLVMGLVTYLLMKFPGIGIASPWLALGFIGGVVLVGLLIYYISKIVRKRSGINIDLVFKELPPE